MWNPAKPAMAALLFGLAVSLSSGQQASRPSVTSGAVQPATEKNHARGAERALTPDDGLSIIAAALDSKVRRHSGGDCSHLVHAIYEQAGFPYAYASSSDLYAGVEGFRRVSHPQPGDVIVWPGHAGIVVRPSRHIFFSFKSAGPGTDDYQAPYWVKRGQVRFYRYIQNDPCPGCTTVSKAARRSRQN